MPLQDHFRPPLSERRRWHSFHHAWAAVLAFELNRMLPEGWFADPNAQFGIEIDVSAWDEKVSREFASWTPPLPTQTIPITLITDIVEVSIYKQEGGPVLAGAIELVSPSNKDRPAHRDAFVSKCASLIQQGIGMVVIDMVTDRAADLHKELVHRLQTNVHSAAECNLWAASYRPLTGEQEIQLEIWHEVLTIGSRLPILPFWLKEGPCIRLDLEATYERARREQRMTQNGN